MPLFLSVAMTCFFIFNLVKTNGFILSKSKLKNYDRKLILFPIASFICYFTLQLFWKSYENVFKASLIIFFLAVSNIIGEKSYRKFLVYIIMFSIFILTFVTHLLEPLFMFLDKSEFMSVFEKKFLRKRVNACLINFIVNDITIFLLFFKFNTS